MYFYYLIEDQSSEGLIHHIMKRVQEKYPNVSYDCKSFKGIGGFTKKNTVKETKDGKLLNDLATYLRGFNKSLQYSDATVFIVVDNDDHNPDAFNLELESVAQRNNITIDHVFCIAVEEMEAWLLGDEEALFKAYPDAKQPVLKSYIQDSICGTWEILADVVYRGGITKMKKECQSYKEIGAIKAEWADRIGQYMQLNSNRSPSFNKYILEIEKRLSVA